MNEQDAALQEKDFGSILGSLLNLAESRRKLICEIDDILDRLKQNRRPQLEPKLRDGNPATKSTEDVISVLRDRLTEIDLDNEKLKYISNRLNELV